MATPPASGPVEPCLSPDPLDVPSLRAAVADAAAGAVLVFEGTVRDHSEGMTGVVALEYEAHPTMAEKSIRSIMAAAGAAFPIRKAEVRHRTGRVELGEPTIVIAVSAAHRDEAYRASRYIIDRIKHETPIWKREIRADGKSAWSRGCTAHGEGQGTTP
jgi:molybdopterin synthase catalytic subunit